MIEAISTLTGIPYAETRMLITIICQILLSILYGRLPVDSKSPNFKKQIRNRELFGLIVGAVSYYYLFPMTEMMIIVASSVVFYYLSFLCKDAKTTMTINFINFSMLCVAHIHRTVFFYEENIYNFNVLLMMLVPKQIYFNSHVHRLNIERTDGDKKEQVEIPTFYEYLCYNFNYIGSLTTPVYSYQEYKDFISQSYGQSKINIAALMKRIGLLLVASGLYAVIGTHHDYNLIDSRLFRQNNILYQLIYVAIQGLFIRVRFYIIWLLAEIMVVLVNFRDADDNYKDYLSAVDIFKLEMNVSPRLRVANWNKSIAKFYRICFYNPFTKYLKIDSTSASLFVFILSAFWHGFYPTYYFSFFFLYLVTMTERIVYRNKEKLWFIPGIFFWIMFDVAGICFKRHTFRSTKEVLKNIWYLVALNFIVHVGIRRYLKYLHKKQKAK